MMLLFPTMYRGASELTAVHANEFEHHLDSIRWISTLKCALTRTRMLGRDRDRSRNPAVGWDGRSQQANACPRRAVNQAVGRVIRHQHDYGAIILCDDRFLGDGVRNHISLWLRDRVELYPNFGAATGSLTTFFKARPSASRLWQQAKPWTPDHTLISDEIRYPSA